VATDCCQTFELRIRKLNWNSTRVCVNDVHSVAEISRGQQVDRQTPNIFCGNCASFKFSFFLYNKYGSCMLVLKYWQVYTKLYSVT